MSARISTLPITRRCECRPDCPKTFGVNVRRGGQRYAYGHSPAAKNKKASGLSVAPPAPRTGKLDYQIAHRSAKQLQERLAQRIDQLDEQIASYRRIVEHGEGHKAELTDQHEMASAAVYVLDQLLQNLEKVEKS